MKMRFKLIALVMLASSLFSNEIAQPINKGGEVLGNQAFYFPLNQGKGSLYFTLDKEKLVDVTTSDIRLISLKDKRVVKVFNLEGRIIPLTLTKDGHYLVLKVSLDGAIKMVLLDLKKEELIIFDEGWIEGECDSPDTLTLDMSINGKYLVYIENTQPYNRVKVWDIASRKLLNKFSTHGSQVKNILVNDVTEVIATRSDSKQADVWSLQGKHLHRFKLKDKEGELTEFEISDNGKYLLMNNQIMNIDSGEMTLYPEYGGAYYPSLSSNSEDFILHTDENSTLMFWSIEKKRVVKLIDMNSSISSVSISSNRDYLKVALAENAVVLIDLKKREIVKRVPEIVSLDGLIVLPHQKHIAMFTLNSELIIQELKGDTLIDKFKLQGGSASISSAQLTKDGKYLFSIDSNNVVCFWDIENNSLLGILQNDKLTDNFFITSNNKYLVLETYDAPIVWDIKKQKVVNSSFMIHPEFSRKMSYMNDHYLISFADKNRIDLYSIENMERPTKEFVIGDDGSWIVFDYIHKKFYRGGNSEFPFSAKVLSETLGTELIPFSQKGK